MCASELRSRATRLASRQLSHLLYFMLQATSSGRLGRAADVPRQGGREGPMVARPLRQLQRLLPRRLARVCAGRPDEHHLHGRTRSVTCSFVVTHFLVGHHSIFIATGSVVPVVMSCSESGISAGASGASGSAIGCSRSRFGIRFWCCFAISLSLFSLVSALVLRIDFRCFFD